MIPTKARVATALAALLAAGLVGCSGHAPQSGPGLPIPARTKDRLPEGVFYVLAGWPNPYSANVWEVTASGREIQLTHNRVGYGISDFAASRAGIVMSDASNGVDELARLTSHGPQWLPAGRAHQPEIGGEGPAITDGGAISYVVPPANYGPAHNDFAVWATGSFTSRGRIVYKQADTLGGEGFGPGGQIAVMDRPSFPPIHGRPAHVLIISPSGKVRTVDTPFAEIDGVVWQPNAVALAVSAVSGTTQLIFSDGQRQLLPEGWQPLTWNPAGDELLAQRDNMLGLWYSRTPRHITPIGVTNRNFTVLNIEWLRRRAPL